MCRACCGCFDRQIRKMTTLNKLQIRGIRSFSPNRDETIEFYSPLTMIVGKNGCGMKLCRFCVVLL
jgi:hypothetical protein